MKITAKEVISNFRFGSNFQYYKLIFDVRPTILRIPGFVWLNIEDAHSQKYEYLGWAAGRTADLGIYKFEGKEAIESPVSFVSSMTNWVEEPIPPKMSDNEFANAMAYFNSKDPDHFFTQDGVKDLTLMHRMVATAGIMVYRGTGFTEAFCLVPTTMTRIDSAFTSEEIETLKSEDPNYSEESIGYFGETVNG
jgi:hypothetical protein